MRIMEDKRIFVGLLLLIGICIQNTVSTATIEEVRAHVATTVALPCRVDTTTCGDLHSVKWYRETSRIYVFSQVGGIARAEGDATERMSVEYAPSSTEALLKISPVEIQDEASYKCEITYLEVRENCDVVQIIKLTTLVIPETVRIIGNDGSPMGNASMLGPLNEGTPVEMICEASAGRPTPKVTWYNGTKELKAHYSSTEDDGLGTGSSKLKFTLSRGDLGAKFKCIVDSKALDEPIVSWMTADVNVRPTSMKLSGVKSHVVQGTNVLLSCDVYGARPAAEVRWFNNSDPITTDQKLSIESSSQLNQLDGTFTTRSTLIFEASRYENGNNFHCYSDNSVIKDQKEAALHEVLLIEVYFPPVVSVNPANITTNETVEILLLCSYISNPTKLDGVVWSRNGKNITLSDAKYEGGNVENPPLIIKNVSRDDMGDYTCTCKNSVGSQESEESIFLNVQYVPTVEVSMDPATPVKESNKTNVTLICSVVVGNPGVLTKVRWFLGGSLLKELPDCNYTSYNDDGEPEGSGGPFCGVDPSIISLEQVQEGMAGNYTCQGMNIAGWGPDSEPQELVVYYPPSPAKVRFTPSKVIKKASVTLDCSVDHPGRPENITFLWYRGSYQVPDVTTSNWTISPVLLETKSNFTCIASNEGGLSAPATVFIDVSAPPAFIQNLAPYQGVLMSSKNISLTCRVECSPLCSITWFKDGQHLKVDNNPLYYVKTAVFPPDLRKNDFESIESTLVWNMTAWPGEVLDRTAANSNYTCQSSPNGIGPGVNSTIEIAVDYPPENLTVSNRVVSVVENMKPEKVVCNGKGHPALTYVWRRDGSAEPLSKSHFLNLGAVPRSASGKYVCEATNRHGTETTNVYLNVQYSPGCTIESVEFEGGPALECTAHANPQEVTFTYKIKGDNDTVEGSNLVHKGLKGYLKLDSSVDSFRTYQCFVNNTVGISSPCERDVTAYQEQSSQIGIPGVAPWWRQFTNENILIIIAIIVGIIIFVIIICIIIIIVCRRKRANNKYTNAVEMEEREKPDGQSPDTSDSKWPRKPGVLLHVNKMNHMNQFTTLGGKQFKTTSVPCHRIPYKSRSKVYAKFNKLRELLGFKDRDSMPFGVYRGSAGVVTFKKFKDSSSPTQTDAVTISRKRKKPGLPPNPSSTADKGRLGAAPPGGGSADPLTDPDKGFYENLPFHGMQNPPNKPISIISPMKQDAPNKSFHPHNYSAFNPLISLDMKKIQRNQSFAGFHNNQPIFQQVYPNPFSLSQNFIQWPQFYPNMPCSHPNLHLPQQQQPPVLPSIFYNLPRSFAQNTGSKTVGAIRTNPQYNPFNYNCRVQSFGNLQSQVYNNPFMITNPFNQPRVSGRNEKKVDIRRTASGINLSNNMNENIDNTDIDNKRFNSLDLKKEHKCYSPTFYSMRCKKHAKKRPIIYTLPKRSNSCQKKTKEINEQYTNLTDSIQIFEDNNVNNSNENIPQAAPRCSKHKCNETIYENVSESIKSKSDETINSNNSSDNCDPDISITEVLIHKPEPTEENDSKFIPKISQVTPKLIKEIAVIKSTPVLKITPTVKVSPNFIKPKTESPKGALFMQLQAKIKSPNQAKSFLKTDNIPNSSALVQRALSQTSLNQSTSSLNKLDPPHSPPKIAKKDVPLKIVNPVKADSPKENQPPVPQMPIIDTDNKWNSVNNTNKNAFYTLTTPHLKQLTSSDMHQQYSATIPHQKHMKLIPRSLFQDQQVAKSKSFSSKSKPKKHFQIPLQKCHSFKFQTAESYFQPIKNIHEENFMRNGYISDLGPNYPESSNRPHKRDKQKTNGPLVLRRPSEYQENRQFQESMQGSVQLQYPQPVVGRNNVMPKPNGVVYADLDMPKTGSGTSKTSSNKKSVKDGHASLSKSQKVKAKTEYATLQFNDVGQEIDV